ncbi:MAG: hypothetical protein CTY16_06875 [Methylobacter sp.]|nr:MAG: hypothetical protein CTY16_06875 [Methylobacter sp.]
MDATQGGLGTEVGHQQQALQVAQGQLPGISVTRHFCTDYAGLRYRLYAPWANPTHVQHTDF